VTGRVAYQRGRREASSLDISSHPGTPSDSETWRNRNGAANTAINGDPPCQRQLPPFRDITSGQANGAVTVAEIDENPAVDRPIVVIDQRLLSRDCLVKCLGEAMAGRKMLAYANATEWLAVAMQNPKPGAILICAARYKSSQGRDDDLRVLKDAGHSPCIVVSDTEDCDQAISALEDGAQGFLPSNVSLDVAVQAVRLVEAGGMFIPARLLILLHRARGGATAQGTDAAGLFTVRQSDVLAALHQGRSNKQIAYQLQMSEGTVKVHVREIMKKVNARNRTEVVLRTQHQDG
jgi:DNA-binding NarL/FixJ family response regulator